MRSSKLPALVVLTIFFFAGSTMPSFAAGSGPPPLPSTPSNPGVSAPPPPPSTPSNPRVSAKKKATADYKLAVKEIQAGNFDIAIDLLFDVLREKPRDADALNYMGYSQRKTGKYDKAVAFYKRALAVKPNHLGANEYLGEAYLEMGKLSEAEQRLAQLKSACGGCEEFLDLKKAVTIYKSKQ